MALCGVTHQRESAKNRKVRTSLDLRRLKNSSAYSN